MELVTISRRRYVDVNVGLDGYDMNGLINIDKMYEPLKDLALFNRVVVDGGGHGVSWNDDIDMSEHELWTNGVEMIAKKPDLTLKEVEALKNS